MVRKCRRPLAFLLSTILLLSSMTVHGAEDTGTSETQPFTLTVSSDNGSVTITGDEVEGTGKNTYKVMPGSAVTAEITPEDGYELESIQLNDSPVTSTADGKAVFDMPQSNSTLKVNYTEHTGNEQQETAKEEPEADVPDADVSENDPVDMDQTTDTTDTTVDTEKDTEKVSGEPEETGKEETEDEKRVSDVPQSEQKTEDGSENPKEPSTEKTDESTEREMYDITVRVHGEGKVTIHYQDQKPIVVSETQTLSLEPHTYVTLLAESEEKSNISMSVTNTDGVGLEPATSVNGTNHVREITVTRTDKVVDVTFGKMSPLSMAKMSIPTLRSASARGTEQQPEIGDAFSGVMSVVAVSGGGGSTVHGVTIRATSGILQGEGNFYVGCAQHSAAAPTVGMRYNYTFTVTDVNTATGEVAGYFYAISQTQPSDGVTTDGDGNLIGYQSLGGQIEIEREYGGELYLRKVSANPEITNGNSMYSLAGARYGVYTNRACTDRVATLTTTASGTSNTVELDAGDYYVQETYAPEGYALDKQVYKVTVVSGETAVVRVSDIPQSDPIGILLGKIDADTTRNMPQGSASLEGAEFTIKYYDGSYTSVPTVAPTRKWVFQTDKDGFIMFHPSYKVSGDDFYYTSNGDLGIPLGTITIQETKAPEGYQPNNQIFIRQITADGTAEWVETYNEPEIPEPIIRGGVRIEKWDHETAENDPQGGASLGGAVLEIVSNNRNPVVVNGRSYSNGSVVMTLKTDQNGAASTSANALPYGDYTVREKTAPEGYLLQGATSRSFSIRQNGVIVNLNTAGTAIRDTVIRGDLELVKFGEPADEEQDQMIPLEGIIFEIKSKTTGQTFRITTDERGFATTKSLNISERGNLVYDTYIINEVNTPPGYDSIRDMEVTISSEGQVLYYILEDGVIVCPVRLVKVDSTTGQTIPLANAEFQLLDKDKNPISMTTHYPSTVVHDTFKTDSTGSFTLPEKLPVGVYYFRELNAPDGYLLNGEDLRFEITEGHDWDAPLEVSFEDTPAMGRIQILKTDSEEGYPLAGAEFTVTAAEDIVTPDGTVRVAAGETVDTIITGYDGICQSKELYLGKYTVTETKQPSGYLRPAQSWDVELVYKDQNTAIVTESLEVKNTPTKIIIKKIETGTDKHLAGVTFEIWNKAMAEDETDPGFSVREAYVTDSNGQITFERLLPGTYCVREIETITGYALNDTVYEFTVSEDGRIDGEEIYTISITNDKTQITETNAIHAATDNQQAYPTQITVVDTVSMVNLQPDTTYQLRGELMDRETGEPVTDAKGDKVSAEMTFTATAPEMDVDVTFQDVDLSGYAGHTVVVFEYLYQDNVEISSHADLLDRKQQLQIMNPKLHTTAIDLESGTHKATAKENITIRDNVDYEDIIPGVYTVKGILMDRETGKPLLIDGKEVTAEREVQITEESGTVTMDFTFDASGLNNRATVVFEYLYQEDELIASHEDITDEDQTVTFRNPELHTTAIDVESGTHEAIAKEDVTIRDHVDYTDVAPGTYTMKGILMDQETGKPLLIDGKEVTAEREVQITEESGTITMDFTLDASGLNNKAVVVFEYLYQEDEPIASHEDITDEDQTVTFKVGSLIPSLPDQPGPGGGFGLRAPKTGDILGDSPYLTVAAALGACIAVMAAVRVRKKRKAAGDEEAETDDEEEEGS